MLGEQADRRNRRRGRRRVRCRPVGLKRETIRNTVATLAMVFDFDGITPKPARDKRVRLPRKREGGIDHFAASPFHALFAAALIGPIVVGTAAEEATPLSILLRLESAVARRCSAPPRLPLRCC